MIRVDCHTHVFPPEYAETLTRNRGWVQAIRRDGSYLVSYGSLFTYSLSPDSYDLGRKIREMDSASIDVSILSVNMPGPELLEPELAPTAARIANDSLAEITQRYSGRFLGLACLPWQDVPAALAEAERAVHELGLRGVVLHSHVGTEPVDHPRFEPVYCCIEALNVPLVLHPCVAPWTAELGPYSMITMVGLMCDQSFAMLRLILSGVMERHPALRVVQPHAGGILPYLWGRIEFQTQVLRRGTEMISQPPGAYYRRVFLDSASPSPPALRYAYDFVGSEHLLFGSDHPWLSPSLLSEAIDEMPIPRHHREQIMGGNAQKLFAMD